MHPSNWLKSNRLTLRRLRALIKGLKRKMIKKHAVVRFRRPQHTRLPAPLARTLGPILGNRTVRRLMHSASRTFETHFGQNASVSMAHQLLILMAALSVLPLLLVGFLTFSKVQATVTQAQRSMLTAHAEGIQHSLEASFQGADNTMKGIAAQSSVLILMEDANQDGVVNDQSNLNTASFALKNAVKGSDGLYESVLIAAKNGAVLAEESQQKGASAGATIADRDFTRRIQAGEDFVIGAPFISESSGHLVIPAARSIKTLAGWNGTLVILFDQEHFMRFLGQTQLGATGAVYLLDAAGIAVYHPDAAKVMAPLEGDLFTDHIAGSQAGFSSYRSASGARIAAWAPMPQTGWTVAATLSRNEFEAGISQIRLFMLIAVLLTALLTALAARSYARAATRPIQTLSVLMDRVAEGDLTAESQCRTNLETAALSDSFNAMLHNLRVLIAQVDGASQSVSEASFTLGALSQQTLASTENMQAAVEQIADGARRQHAAADTGQQRIEAMADFVQKIHGLSESILQAAQSTEAAAALNAEQLTGLKEAGRSGREAADRIDRETAELNEALSRIGAIVEAISKIAKTTNLLALNAAIEAARAGDAGRGFAVVADEVRKLADQTTQEATGIRRILGDVQNKALRMTAVVRLNGETAAAQMAMADTASGSLDAITHEIHRTTQEVANIADAIHDLNESMSEIVSTMGEVTAVAAETAVASDTARTATQEQFDSVGHLRDQSEDLSQLSRHLSETLRIFQLQVRETHGETAAA